MGTQGVVSVVEKISGRVLMKIITGMDGYNAKKLAKAVKEKWPLNIEEAYELAKKIGFGPKESLVVMTASNHRYDGNADLNPRYHETFDNPRFNPRWEFGTADHVEIVEVGT